MNKTPSQ